MKDKMVFLICLVLLNACIRIDTGKKESKAECFKGIITKIFQDDKQHYMYTFEIHTPNQIIIENAEIWSKSWSYAQVGDSIIKPADTLMIIIKKNDSTKREFFYKF